jgi:hypothetical protein
MNNPQKSSFWILAILFSLIFLGSVIFLAYKLTSSEAVWTLPLYIGVFFLSRFRGMRNTPQLAARLLGGFDS